ncbi:MAG TPA: hypothetical protein VFO62_10790 [Candidatus Binatia bacterium]|nr:hypothetical protein [Candidatus Binatia bacterium]
MSAMVLHEAGLEFRSEDGEPRIRDLDLAERLGYERPRKIRDIIREAQKVNGFGICPVSGQNHDGGRGRPADEYWLTERQALFVTTRSGTEKAAEATLMLVDAFLAVREQIRRSEQAHVPIWNRLLDAIVLPKPAEEWERMFQDTLVKALCDLYGKRWSSGSHPRFLSIVNRKIYNAVFSTEIGRKIKERNPKPEMGTNHHQCLTPEARAYFAEQLRIVEAIARQSGDKADFWRRMEREYAGGMLQLSLARGA